MSVRNAISLRHPPATTGREMLENAAKIKVIVYPCRGDLRNSFFILLWKPIMDRRTATGRKEKIRYSPRVRRGLPQPEVYFSRKIPVIPRSVKKIKKAIFIFLGKNLILIMLFGIMDFVIQQPHVFGVIRLYHYCRFQLPTTKEFGRICLWSLHQLR